ncbi:hypothetical protein D3822_29885, partial [Escherichia coli]
QHFGKHVEHELGLECEWSWHDQVDIARLKSRPDPTPSDEILAMRFPFIFRHVKRIPGLSA